MSNQSSLTAVQNSNTFARQNRQKARDNHTNNPHFHYFNINILR